MIAGLDTTQPFALISRLPFKQIFFSLKRTPTPKQVRTAKGIAKHEEDAILSPDVLEDAEACQQFIDYYQRWVKLTPEQVQQASEFERSTGLVPPEEVKCSKNLLFHWNLAMESVSFVAENLHCIFGEDEDENLPTVAMTKFAESLANEHGIEMPDRVVGEKESCHSFIRYCLAHRPPSEELADTARLKSETLGIETPELILRSKDATIRWVSILKRLEYFQQGHGQRLPSPVA